MVELGLYTFYFQTAKDIVAKVFTSKKVETVDDCEQGKFVTELLVEMVMILTKLLRLPRPIWTF